MLTTTMTTKGQVTIPRDIRKALGVSPGDRVLFTHASDGSVIVSIVPKNVVVTLFGSLASRIRVTDYRKAREAAARVMGKKYQIP